MTVITNCKGCGEQVTVDVDNTVDYKNGIQSCPKCENRVSNASVIVNRNGISVDSSAYTNDATASTTVVVKTAEERALDELKAFCIR